MKAIILSLVLAGAPAFAATHEVKMLNNGKDGIMVFEPAYLKAAKGDSVKFTPTDAAHEVSSVLIPKKAKPFKGELNKSITVKLTEDGVYLYQCASHLPMAMVGIIQVGDPSNLAEAKKAGTEQLVPKFALNKDRLDKYFSMVK